MQALNFRLKHTAIAFALLTYYSMIACDKDEQLRCLQCSENTELLDEGDGYFRFFPRGANNGPTLVSQDSVSGTQSEFSVCLPTDIADTIEESQIIKSNYQIFKTCEVNGPNIIVVEDMETVTNCSPSVPAISKSFPLEVTIWLIYSVTTADTTVLVPCETFPQQPMTLFNKGEMTVFDGVNNVHGPAEIIQNKIHLHDYIKSLDVGTTAQTFFAKQLYQVLSRNSEITFQLKENTLLLTNPLSQSTIKLYTQ
ncbi:hypothetical protein WBG78_30525 [Chryseolinea sp. T2]|uniref:hypothetical protein n=1 Tax=Chryseolinea sp. T2 TaxID=3129255 RepID=UPI0030773E21